MSNWITEAEQAIAGATPGPWIVSADDSSGALYHLLEPKFWALKSPKEWAAEDQANAVFIAIARTALPRALKENQALRAEVERLRKALHAASDDIHNIRQGSQMADDLNEAIERIDAALSPAAPNPQTAEDREYESLLHFSKNDGLTEHGRKRLEELRAMLSPAAQPAREDPSALCFDCPPVGYPTNKTRCECCPRRFADAAQSTSEATAPDENGECPNCANQPHTGPCKRAQPTPEAPGKISYCCCAIDNHNDAPSSVCFVCGRPVAPGKEE